MREYGRIAARSCAPAPSRSATSVAATRRAYVEQNAPYLVLHEGTIELSRIVTHDDVEL